MNPWKTVWRLGLLLLVAGVMMMGTFRTLWLYVIGLGVLVLGLCAARSFFSLLWGPDEDR